MVFWCHVFPCIILCIPRNYENVFTFTFVHTNVCWGETININPYCECRQTLLPHFYSGDCYYLFPLGLTGFSYAGGIYWHTHTQWLPDGCHRARRIRFNSKTILRSHVHVEMTKDLLIRTMIYYNGFAHLHVIYYYPNTKYRGNRELLCN